MRETIANNAPLLLAVGGLLIGAIFGATVYWTNYCAMGSLSDIHNFNDYRRFRAWILAATTAVLGTQVLQFAGVVALERSMYLAPNFNWLGYIIGGLVFGVGMVMAGGCPSRNLARAGGGDLRALLTLIVLGLVAYMTIAGIIAPLRATFDSATALSLAGAPSQSIADLLSRLTGISPRSLGLIITALIVAAGLGFCFSDARFRNSPTHVFSGVAIGATVVAGWALTGLAFDDMAARPVAPISLTYVRPMGDTLQWLALFTATPVPGFGVASVFGALVGACAAAVAKGRFRLSTYSDTEDTVRNLVGAAMMGVGGVMALGCTVGQAITGVSTLALGSFVTFAAIIVGGFYGLKLLERWVLAAE